MKKIDADRWQVDISIFKKRALQPGEAWERRPDGSKVLTRNDPASGEKSYAILWSVEDSERMPLFRAEVKMPAGTVTLHNVVEVAGLDPGLFELFYDEVDGPLSDPL